MAERITNKAMMFERLSRGDFGNSVKSWNATEFANLTLNDISSSRHYGVRTATTPGVVLPGYSQAVRWWGALDIVESWEAEYGIPRSKCIVSEHSPDDLLIAQGELTRGVRGLEAFYSTAKNMPMRPALHKSGRTEFGLALELKLKHWLTPESWEDIQALLDDYPDHVIEFGIYGAPVGHVAGRNHLIWEVRAY